MLRIFKDKRAEERMGYPSFALRKGIDTIVQELKDLSSTIKGLKIIGRADRFIVKYGGLFSGKTRLFDLYKEPKNIEYEGIVHNKMNVVQFAEAPVEIEDTIYKGR